MKRPTAYVDPWLALNPPVRSHWRKLRGVQHTSDREFLGRVLDYPLTRADVRRLALMRLDELDLERGPK